MLSLSVQIGANLDLYAIDRTQERPFGPVDAIDVTDRTCAADTLPIPLLPSLRVRAGHRSPI